MKAKSIIRNFGLFFSLPATLILLGLTYKQTQERQSIAHRDVLTKTIGTLGAAATLYAKEHDNHLPPGESWEQVLRPDAGNIPLQVPVLPGGAGKRVAMNKKLAGRSLDTIKDPSAAILFYESTATVPSPVDDLTSLVPPGDPSPLILGFADGHIEEFVKPSEREQVLARSLEACKEISPATLQAKSAHTGDSKAK